MTDIKKSAKSVTLSFLLAGLSVGWLAGLSVSPVLATILTAVLGALVGVTVAKKAVEEASTPILQAWPLAIFLFGVAAFAPLGIVVRTHGMLERRNDSPTTTGSQDSDHDAASRAGQGVLFATSTDQCERLTGSTPSRLRTNLRTSSLPWARAIEANVDDESALERIVSQTCDEAP